MSSPNPNQTSRPSNEFVGEVYGKYFERLVRYLSCRYNESQAPDMAHDAFVKFMQSDYDPDRSHVWPFLKMLGHQTSVDTTRREERHRSRMMAVGLRNYEGIYDPVQEGIIRQETIGEVQAAMTQITDLQRQTPELGNCGLTLIQISEQVDAPLSTVKTRRRDGLTAMRPLLAACGLGPNPEESNA